MNYIIFLWKIFVFYHNHWRPQSFEPIRLRVTTIAAGWARKVWMRFWFKGTWNWKEVELPQANSISMGYFSCSSQLHAPAIPIAPTYPFQAAATDYCDFRGKHYLITTATGQKLPNSHTNMNMTKDELYKIDIFVVVSLELPLDTIFDDLTI